MAEWEVSCNFERLYETLLDLAASIKQLNDVMPEAVAI